MKRQLIFLLILCFTLPAMSQIRVDINKKINNEANRRANRHADNAIDKSFDKVDEGISDIFKKKQDKAEPDQRSDAKGTDENNSTATTASFTSLVPAEGSVTVAPIKCSWEMHDKKSYKFTVHLEGDDWSDWLTMKTSKNECTFSKLPTATKNLKWQVIAEGKGERLESPWQNFTLSDGSGDATAAKPKQVVEWAKYDFVPGDEVIFEDGPSASEENGEFPSKWDLKDGNAEIAEVDGEKVVIFPHGGSIVPFLKNSKEDYLPEVFTVEFDVYFQPENPHRLFYSFFDDKNQRNIGTRIYFYSKSISYDESSAPYSKGLSNDEWRHFSIAVTKDKLKVYLNDERLINIPHMGFNPTGITLEMYGYAADKVHQYVKNIRIAKGGVKYYDRVLSDGKIIVNGIRFDVNKATIKPESNGAINEIFQLMQKQTDLNFSVEGHTDSDGDEIKNQALSESRAKAVMERLISLGISSNRLKSAGWGESKPIADNGTPEGKANNRRVEFVKF